MLHGLEDARTAAEFLDQYCSRCHNDERLSGDWSLSEIHVDDLRSGLNLRGWEQILRMTRDGNMPPADRPQPADTELAEFTGWLQAQLDGFGATNPNPGRATLRRLNRAEYANAVRDLLGLDIDIREDLPADDSGYGFDNIADVLSVSSTLMDRYVSLAGKLSRLAVGLGADSPVLSSFSVPKDGSILNQGIPAYNERSSESLPLDSRGGAAFDFYAPQDGSYEISGYLNANTNNEVDRLEAARESLRVELSAGPHSVGMSFRKFQGLDESVQTLRNNTDIVALPSAPPQLLTLDFVVDGARVGSTSVPSYLLTPRYAQNNFPRDVLQIDVLGPYGARGPGSTASRRRIFRCDAPAVHSASATHSSTDCARQILKPLARQAYRRPVTEDDLSPLLRLFELSRAQESFEAGIATAIQALLISPRFLFLIEEDPVEAAPGSVHRLSDLEFAARLSLFLWSSLPDEELLTLAEQGVLREPPVLDAQLWRMLADPRSRALTDNFAGQWLYLRNLEHHRADVMAFPEFDVRLRRDMRRESERFFAHILRENRSVLEFIAADYSFLNQRLAQHYGIDGVVGTGLRRVALQETDRPGGLLAQASLLTVTSYANHTSVVKRGQWILDHLLAAPPPPPPPDVPALVMKAGGKALNAREQMALHREDPACASCHVKMDPLGLALEQYDAIGSFRLRDAGQPIDASAELPDGTRFTGLEGLQSILLERRDQFTRALGEQLLVYALGRGLEPADRPQLRAIASATAADDYRLHTMIRAIVGSLPFNYRTVPQRGEPGKQL
jgi:hypothetical protein